MPIFLSLDEIFILVFARYELRMRQHMVHSPGYADDLRQYTSLNMATRVPKEDFPPCDKR